MSTNSSAELLRDTTWTPDAPAAMPTWLEERLDAACSLLRRNRLKLSTVVVFASMFLGCGNPDPIDLASIPIDGGAIQTISDSNPLFARTGEGALDDGQATDADLALDAARWNTMAPNPERTNPFEFAGEFAYHGTQGEAKTDAASIRLYGFAGDAPIKAVISAGGRTRMLTAGEKWGVIELLEVTPPQAKIRIDGVTRNLSLLGQTIPTE